MEDVDIDWEIDWRYVMYGLEKDQPMTPEIFNELYTCQPSMSSEDDPALIDVIGMDRLKHKAYAHSTHAKCGMKIFAKDLMRLDPKVQHFSCYECTY